MAWNITYSYKTLKNSVGVNMLMIGECTKQFTMNFGFEKTRVESSTITGDGLNKWNTLIQNASLYTFE